MPEKHEPLYWAAWLILLTIVAFLSRSYIPIDETRYLSVAWEMWQRGDFLVPFKNGEPYSHKPPLLFWLMHFGWAITGVNDWWPRLISPLLAFASLFLVRHLALALWPDRPEASRLAPWVLMGSMLWSLYSQTIMFDVLMAFCTLLGMLGLVRAAWGKSHGWKLFALAIGLGILAKGPAILLHLLPGALLAPWWAQGRVTSWPRWYGRVLLAALGGAALALLWAIPAGMTGGEEYRNAIFWGQTANRMVQSFAHQRPFWWYVPLLPLLLFPWLVWPAFWRGAKAAAKTRDHGLRFLMAWMFPAFLAFSLVSGKQIHYLLPEFPAFALLAGRLLSERQTPGRPWPVALMLAVFGVLMFLVPHHYTADPGNPLNQVPIWAGGVFLLLAGAAWRMKDTPAALVPRLSALAMLAMAGAHLVLIRPISPAYDVRPMGAAIAQVQAESREVANQGNYHAQYQFAGRLKHALAELDSGPETLAWLRAHPHGAVVMYFPGDMDLSPFHPLFAQPFRGRLAALLATSDALAAKAKSQTLNDPSAEQ